MNRLEISLNLVPGEELAQTFELGPEEVAAEFRARGCPELGIEGSARSAIRLKLVNGELELTGEVGATLTVACVRCLEPFTAPVRQEFRVKVLRSAREKEGEEEEAADVEVASGEKLDLTALLYDQLLLGLPEYPLCKPECKGLCPTCGVDLNREKCGCGDQKKVDPRLAVLAGLKKAH